MSDRPSEPALHPIAARLEELAAGGPDAAAEQHLATCQVCAAHVAKLREAAEIDLLRQEADQEADAFLDRVAARARDARDAEDSRDAHDAHDGPSEVHGEGESGPDKERVERLAGDANKDDNVVRPLVWLRVAWVAAPLVAAALLLLFVRPPSPREPLDDAPPRPASASAVHFKGGAQVAVVVEHDGHQQRETSEVRAGPGDRLRIEVSLDEEGPIVAGILEHDGTWTPLLPAALLEAGTHYSDQAARLDDAGATGWVLAGAPDAVARARETHDFSRVTVLPIVPMR